MHDDVWQVSTSNEHKAGVVNKDKTKTGQQQEMAKTIIVTGASKGTDREYMQQASYISHRWQASAQR